MTLRKARPSDLEAIVLLDHKVLKTNWHERLYLEEITNKNTHFWILELEGLIVGFLAIKVIADEGEILQFAVDPVYQGQGFGSLLIDYALENLNIMDLFLEVADSNEIARKFYKKYDFQLMRIRKNYYGPDQNGIEMRKRLK
ncbi:MAG: ribosomal protein S18-alanine N-acetyltransferase [Erysipelothrix sp.]|nr:ribosomal protein S18-alanine N-acetyltransferase [Erysipelothrix sp.]